MGGDVFTRALRRAEEVVGGRTNLREELRVSMRALELWLSGAEKPPTAIFLKAVDIISSPQPSEARPGPVARVTQLLPPPATAPSFLETKFEPAEGREMVQSALDAAMTATRADMGNIQLLCPEGLRIVAHRGFEQPFLDFFSVVVDRGSACGVARMAGRRIVVSEVTTDLLFAGTPAGEALATAGVRAVQSTPLVGSGGVIGMLSTHYAAPHLLSEHDEDMLDHIARRAAFWLEGGAL